MSQRIAIEIEVAKGQLDQLKRGIEAFKPFTKEYTKNQKVKLEGMNADFIEDLKGILSNMADDSGPEMLQKIMNFHQKAEAVVRTMKLKDEELSEEIAEEKGVR